MSNRQEENQVQLVELAENTAISRRKLLGRLGMAGVAIAAGSLATQSFPNIAQANEDKQDKHDDEAVEGRFNVKRHGALGDGAADDAAAIQALIDSVALTGGVVFFPQGTYLIGTSLTIPSNITLQGVSAQLSIMRDHPSLGGNRIFTIFGTAASRKSNIKLLDLTIRNGTAVPYGTGPTGGKDGIRASYVDGFTLVRCTFTEIEGTGALFLKFCAGVQVENCLFYRVSYMGMGIGPDCENVKVRNSTFDTVTTTISGNAYTLAMGGDTLGEGTSWPKNVWIENNKFLNNPHWEGLDSHGGENIWILNNYIENCYVGIHLGNTTGFVSNPVLKNIVVEGNQIIRGTGDPGLNGIVAQGLEGAHGVGLTFRNNRIDGFGPLNNPLNGGILLTWMQKFVVEGNIIDHFHQNGIVLNAAVYDGIIRGNVIRSCSGAFQPAETTAIRLSFNGIFGIVIEDNVVNPQVSPEDTNFDKIPKYFISCYNRNAVSVQVRNNAVHNIGTALYLNPNNMNVEWAAMPAASSSGGINQKYGDVIYNTSGIPAWYVTGPKIGFGSLYTGVVTKGSMTAGSRTLNSGDYYLTKNYPEGMNIKVAGAGPGGTDLLARVVNNESSSGLLLELDTAAGTTVTGANIYYQPLALTPLM